MSNNAVTNTLDSNFGSLSNAWNVPAPVNGAVTLSGNSAMMEWATGRDAGHGYGTYTVTAKVDGNQPGPGIILWPGDNQWPGQEIDMLEITPDGSGRQYGTVHWNNNGADAYQTAIYEGVSSGQFHDYQMVWAPGEITFKVDGKTMGSFNQHIPTDFDHGGMNNTIGVMNNNPATSITVSHIDFTPLGASAPAAATASVAVATPVADIALNLAATASATTAPVDTSHGEVIDWNALAAQVTANFEATGHWFI
ncbi:family 16 glycosylhydrolase [Paeniroseomonas aquatica]|uniref:Family 16 glycosylhydrolase n=1 Tax=Paeniroseomonas aquatica TaxID=373043 RepID=A0ABT8A2A6_9PROT|nr:family 16 glycosylhydrolase [Paeniroseomonas aquatica]MDN3563808.1 family 16 glycosylhydrolase [Paeniroseomonas aquatica]